MLPMLDERGDRAPLSSLVWLRTLELEPSHVGQMRAMAAAEGCLDTRAPKTTLPSTSILPRSCLMGRKNSHTGSTCFSPSYLVRLYHIQRHATRAWNSGFPTAGWSMRNILPEA